MLSVKLVYAFTGLGAIMRDTKNNSLSGVSNRNFSLLGDPAMKLALPNPEMKVSKITNTTSGSDTLKALSKIKVTGDIYSNGLPDVGYLGTLSATLFDKFTIEKTKGDENAPFEFKSREGVVFNGQATINNGHFEFEFTIPNSIDLSVGAGKLGLYAFPKGSSIDFSGVSTSVKIGAIEKNPGTDSRGPAIELFMGDSTFANGGIADRNSRVLAILSDENGINISDFTPQNNITATLDDTLSIVLNKYYQSDVDNVKRGEVNYPLDNIKPGHHQLVLRASDTFGNSSAASISFSVSDENGIQIEQWLNYPNPFANSTNFYFKHNRSGDDLEATVTVYNQVGQTVLSSTYQMDNSSYQVTLPEWDASTTDGLKLSPGLYLVKLSVRSEQDGSKNEKITKVIITN